MTQDNGNNNSTLLAQAMEVLITAQEAQRKALKEKRRAARAKRQAEDAATGSTRKSYSVHLALSVADHEKIRSYIERHAAGESLNSICTRFILEGIDRAAASEGDGGSKKFEKKFEDGNGKII